MNVVQRNTASTAAGSYATAGKVRTTHGPDTTQAIRILRHGPSLAMPGAGRLFSTTRFADLSASDALWELLSLSGPMSVETTQATFGAGSGDPLDLSDDMTAGLGEYESMLVDSTGPAERQEPLHGVPLFSLPVMQRVAMTARTVRTRTNEQEVLVDQDEESAQEFSITHPVWGFLEVDSRRLGASWEVVVRCDDDDTRQRLADREQEFRELLRNSFGVDLTLDVKPTRVR